MTTHSLHTNSTDSTNNEAPHPRSQPLERHDAPVRRSSVRDRDRIGRFDDGMATYPNKNRERIGRFDDGMAEDRLAA